MTTFLVEDVEGLHFYVESGEIINVDRLPPALAGLERTTGSIRLDGRELANEPPDRIAARGVSFVPAGRRVFGDLTVEENLTLGAYRARRDKALVTQRRDRAYTLFPWLASRPKQLARTLSGGEQQMLVVARGLMSDPAVLLLEEPSAGLADDAVEALRIAIESLTAAVVLSDQRLSEIARVASV
jgi:branched-chain amino acid transport system ATP-binding protein